MDKKKLVKTIGSKDETPYLYLFPNPTYSVKWIDDNAFTCDIYDINRRNNLDEGQYDYDEEKIKAALFLRSETIRI